MGEPALLQQPTPVVMGPAFAGTTGISWGLDDLIVQQATAALGGRFQVQPVSYQRAAFAAIKDSPVAPVGLTGPSRLVDESFSPDTGDPARNENLHGAITDVIARSLSSTLSDMHLAEVR